MKKIQIHQTDSFTAQLFGGNPAGVVFDADKLTDEEMKNIAGEMNLSETAFILEPTQIGANVRLRYFTAGRAEIKFCGHATVASLFEIGRAGRFDTKDPGQYKLNVETNVGILPMEIVKKSDLDIAIRFTAPEVKLENYKLQHNEFAKRFGIPASVISKQYPIMVDRNLNYIYLGINSLKELGALKFNFQQIIDNFNEDDDILFCLLTPETFEKENTLHARGLAPLVGIPEDPFTGSMQAGLATYALINKMIPEGLQQIKTEQGHFMQRPGFALIDLPSKNNNSFVITGKAVHVFTAEMTL